MGEGAHKRSIVVPLTDLALFESSVFDFLHFGPEVLNRWRYLWSSAARCLPPGVVAWVLTLRGRATLCWEATFSWLGPPAIRNERNAASMTHTRNWF